MDRSTPFIEVTVAGRPVSTAFYTRLSTASIHDAPGQEADTCELVFDDSGNEIEVPEKGARITVKFGFRGGGGWKMGVFDFDKAMIGGGANGELLTLSCRSADMRSDVKEPLSEHFDDTTIGDIVEHLARRHKHTAKISPELASIKIDYVARAEQSAVDFLTRLADRTNALFAIKGNQFLFLTRGTLQSVSIDKTECESWSFSIEPRPKYGKVAVGWYDRTSNKTVFEEHSTGLEGPVKRLRKSYGSAAEAKKAAEAESDRLGRATGSGSLTLGGRPEIMADTPIIATGFRKEASGQWQVASVDHVYGDTYLTTINLEAPKEGKK